MSKELVLVVVDQEPRVDSRLLAERLGIEHESFIRTIKKFNKDIEDLGVFRFKIAKVLRTGRPQSYCLLNEEQSIFVLTLSRNSEQVVELKKDLTKQFMAYRRKQSLPVLDNPFEMMYSALVIIQNTQEALKKEIKEVKEEMNSRFLKLEQKKTLVVSNTPKVIPIKLTVRQKCRQYIEEYNRKYGIEHSELWNRAYAEMRFRYGKNFTLRAKRSGVNTIEMIEKLGLINELYSVIREIFNDKTILPEKPVRQILVKKQDVEQGS